MPAVADRLKILVVEDETLNRALLRAVLERANDERLRNAALTEATTVAEARAVAAACEYGLILLDRRLPDGDGLQLAREIREAGCSPSPIILALTADAVPATQVDAMAAGCTAILIKPYRPSDLTSLLIDLLDAPETAIPASPALIQNPYGLTVDQ